MSEVPGAGPGTLILVCGPSGAGKDTLLSHAAVLHGGDPRIVFARRVVTRPGSRFEDHDSVSDDAFDVMARDNAFAFAWDAHGHRYGIPASIDGEVAEGRCVVVNASRLVVETLRGRYARLVAVLVTASPEILQQRLAARGRASDGDTGIRLTRTREVGERFRPDFIIHNDGAVEPAARQLAAVIGLQLSAIASETRTAAVHIA